jgi:flagellar motor switch protein FliN/FliY
MPDPVLARSFGDRLVAEFATAVEAVLGSSVAVVAAPFGEGPGWIVRMALSGPLSGTMAVSIGDADVAALVQRVLGNDDPPDDASIVDLLREMWTQAVSALGLKDPFNGVKAVVSTPETGAPGPDGVGAYELTLGEGAPLRLSVAGEVTVAPVAVAVAEPVAKTTALAVPESAHDANARLEVVLDIDLPLVVRFGRTLMSIKALADLGPGSIVDMGRSPDEPVEMLIGDRVIARGEVVVVGGNYGVRIMDLVSSVERVRAVGR